MQTITIDYFTDMLCVWAYIAQSRIDELNLEFGQNIQLQPRFFPVFGHAQAKLNAQWKNKGDIKGYAEHVHSVAKKFDHIVVHPDIWIQQTPTSSLPAHLYLSAIKLLEKESELAIGECEKMTWALRKAFFTQCTDISNTLTLLSLFEEKQLPIDKIQAKIQTGEAFAILSEDMKMASELSVKASPTLIFNEDRQRLTGNVGYRIIQANIRELLNTPVGQHSWC